MAAREPEPDVLLAVFDPSTELGPILDRLRQVGVRADSLDIVSPVPLREGFDQKHIDLYPYVITILAGFVGIAVGIFFAAGTAVFYPLMTGGKPIVAIPVVGIISYETMMLFAIVVTFLVMLKRIVAASRNPLRHHPQIDEGSIGIAVSLYRNDPLYGISKRMLQEAGAKAVRTP